MADLSYCYADHAAGEPCPTADSADTSLRQSRTNHKTGVTSVFDHDQGNRLVEALNVHGQDYAYTYDANSNRTTVTVDGQQTQQRSFNSANQITNSGYTYDGAGNLTSTPRLPEITYNGADQMSTVSTADGGHYHFGYAGTNQVERIRSGGRNFTTGPLGIQSVRRSSMTDYVERDASGAMLAYQSTQGGAVEGHTDYYYVRDGLGSVIAMVQQNGDLAADYDYSPYGKTLSATGKSINGANRFRYAGGYQGKWSELTKFGHRYYNQDNGRWTQQDRLNQQLDPVNANRYAYAACNPTTYVDPTGKSAGETALYALSLAGECVGGALVAQEAIALAVPLLAAAAGVSFVAVEISALLGGCIAGVLSAHFLGTNVLSPPGS